MTDNEIIKALELCQHDTSFCNACPYESKGCIYQKSKDALDLINRQKAEIERYEKEHREKFDKWQLLDKRTKERYAELYEEAKEIVRAEAIKEFAERLKERFFNYYEGLNEHTSKSNYNGETLMFYEVADMIEDCIENLVKEMTEAQSEQRNT